MKNKFRFLANYQNGNSVSLGRLLSDEMNVLDSDFLLSLHNEAIESEKEFAQDRIELEGKITALQERAKELGGKLTGVDFEGDNPIPSEIVMREAIEQLRLAYLAALVAKNLHLFVGMADRGELGMIHQKRDVTKTGSNGYSKWEYVNHEDFIQVPCKEKITARCAAFQSDMQVLEWNASGTDSDGEYSDTGFPSKWNTYLWRIPLSVKLFTKVVWKGAKVKCNQYDDFRDLFFPIASYGTGNGTGRCDNNSYPKVWNRFDLNQNSMQYKFPIGYIEWNDRVNVTEIMFRLIEDGKQIKPAKTIT